MPDAPRPAQGGSVPQPDPTKLTTDAIEQARDHTDREIRHLREYFEAILNEQRRGMLVAEQEREKSAQALAVTLAEQIRVGDQALRDHVDQQVQQIRAALDASEELEKARIQAGEERTSAVQRELQLMMTAAQQAIVKAEMAAEKRFEGVNEWRDQSADRERSMAEQTTKLIAAFMPREVADAQIAELRRSLAELTEKVNKLV